MKTVAEFIEGLRAIDEPDFTVERVARYFDENPIEPESVAPYEFYEPTHYTRNLIYRCPLFELMAICWDVGQSSRIHNHHNQNCWMAVPAGRLIVQNYRIARLDEGRGYCELVEADRVVMDPQHPAHVDPATPIHAVLNPDACGRTTSLHVYSRPYDRCLVYAPDKNAYADVPLFFDSEYGRRTTG
jgi:cysteine dioxygenase